MNSFFCGWRQYCATLGAQYFVHPQKNGCIYHNINLITSLLHTLNLPLKQYLSSTNFLYVYFGQRKSKIRSNKNNTCIWMSRDFILCSVSLHTRYHFDLDTRYGKISHVLNLLKVNGELICVCNKWVYQSYITHVNYTLSDISWQMKCMLMYLTYAERNLRYNIWDGYDLESLRYY